MAVPQKFETTMKKAAYEKKQSDKKRKKLIYIGSAVAVVGIASYFIFKNK